MKVKVIKKTSKRKKVYDLEVPRYHNFAVNGGIFVHNCIDAVRYATEQFWTKRGNQA